MIQCINRSYFLTDRFVIGIPSKEKVMLFKKVMFIIEKSRIQRNWLLSDDMLILSTIEGLKLKDVEHFSAVLTSSLLA